MLLVFDSTWCRLAETKAAVRNESSWIDTPQWSKRSHHAQNKVPQTPFFCAQQMSVRSCQIWRWMFWMNWAVVWSSSLDPHSLSRPEVSPRWPHEVFFRVCGLDSFVECVLGLGHQFHTGIHPQTPKLPPKGGRGISDVSPLSGISGLPVWSHFSICPLLFFCLILSLFMSYLFLLLAHFPDLFFPKPPYSER